MALHFFGHGSYQEAIGKHLNIALSQPSVSRCINQIAGILSMPHILNQHVHFPENREELRDLRTR